MKRLIPVLIIVSMLFLVAGCASQNITDNTKDVDTESDSDLVEDDQDFSNDLDVMAGQDAEDSELDSIESDLDEIESDEQEADFDEMSEEDFSMG